MLIAKLDPLSVLNEAKQVYQKVKENGKWLATQHATDSKALKSDYGGALNLA